MFLSGFADEAADAIEDQIDVTRKLGWKYIELRAVTGGNIHDIPDPEFDRIRGLLAGAGIGVNAVGSTIANWGRDWNEDFTEVTATLERAIRRMKILGTPQIRIMSWKVLYDPDGRAAADQKEGERIRRLREIGTYPEDAR